MVARHTKTLWWVAAASLAGAAACFLLVKLTGPLPGELRFEAWRVGGGYPTQLDRPMTFVGYLGDTWVGVGLVLVYAAVVAEEIGPRWALLVPAAAGGAVFVELLSEVLGSTADEYDGAAGPNFGFENNFPSGHSAYAVAVYGLLSWLALERGHRALGVGLALPALLMGPCLALLGNHYPADIVAGYGVGLAWLIGVLVVGDRWARATPSNSDQRLAAARGDAANS